MKIAVIGANGYIARNLVQVIEQECRNQKDSRQADSLSRRELPERELHSHDGRGSPGSALAPAKDAGGRALRQMRKRGHAQDRPCGRTAHTFVLRADVLQADAVFFGDRAGGWRARLSVDDAQVPRCRA